MSNDISKALRERFCGYTWHCCEPKTKLVRATIYEALAADLARVTAERDRARKVVREIYEQCDSVHVLALCISALRAPDTTGENT